MSKDRATDVRVERAAVLAVEHSIVTMTDLTVAHPTVDWGIDLLAFQPDPLTVAGVQVKGASSGFTVLQQYATQKVIIAHVLDPLGNEPTVCLFSGTEAWSLPGEYIDRGGKASCDEPDYDGKYRWAHVTKLLHTMLSNARPPLSGGLKCSKTPRASSKRKDTYNRFANGTPSTRIWPATSSTSWG